jgi:nucleoside-diphosphate-sugar epimerase
MVTGATGFVGGNICRDLLSRGHNVYSLVYDGDPPSGTIPVEADITDERSLRFPDLDGVVHCAGMLESSHPSREILEKVNIKGTKNVFREAARAGARNFVFMSTVMVLGPRGSKKKPLTEDMEPEPKDPYGLSKTVCERYLKEASRKLAVNTVVLRAPVIYGGGMNPHSSGMKTFQSIRKGIMPLVGKGDTIFNLLYVGNLCQAVYLSLESKKDFTVYHVNEGPYTLRYAIDEISDVLGVDKGYRKIPGFLFWILTLFSEISKPVFKGPPPISWTKYRSLTSDIWNMDYSRIRSELNYEPLYTLREGAKLTKEYYGW